jgi:hypothetical protein
VRNAWLLAGILVVAGWGISAQGQEPRKYAALSLVGDAISVVTHRMSTGSHRDRNLVESVAISEAELDKVALLAVDDAIRRARPGSAAVLMSAPSPQYYSEQRSYVDGEQFLAPREFVDAVKATGATHLILITKYRGEARVRTRSGSTGSGTFEGLGFYVDWDLPTIRGDTREQGQGFLAPFVYVQACLIHLESSKIMSTEKATASTMLSSARNEKGTDPWGVLSAPEKVERLRKMLRREVLQVVSKLVAKP